MSFRRFVFLVNDEFKNRHYSYVLRRFDVGRLFLSKADRDRLAYPPAVEEGQLPDPEIKFDKSPGSVSHVGIQATRFLLFGGTSHGRCRVDDVKVLSVDPMGHALIYDTEHNTIRALRSFATPKFAPFSLTDGKKNLYVMDSWFTETIKRDDCFQALVYDRCKLDWTPRSLPAPPYAPWFEDDHYRYSAHVMSYAVVGGSSLWFSKESLGTHCFDTASSEWTKLGDWALPFYGRVEYVPEQGLFFGLTTRFDEEDSLMGAADLTVAPWTARILWKDDLQPQPHRASISANLVYLGQSRFCHARFYDTWTPGVVNSGSNLVVLTALEVERRGDELAVVKHRSVQYNFKYRDTKSVL